MGDTIRAAEILKIQDTAKNHIKGHFDNFKKKGANKMTRELAETRVLRLRDLWKQFLQNDETLRNCDDVDFTHKYFSEDVLYEMQEVYDDVFDLYTQFLKTQPPAAIQAQGQATIQNPPPSQHQDDLAGVSAILKYFPQTVLPTFSGKTSDWPHFRDMYVSLIHKQPAPPIMKLNCLHTHLNGEALDVIKNITISDANYELAWDTLKLHYENLRRLVQNHLSEIFIVKPMSNESSVEIKRVINQVFTPFDALTGLGRPTKYWSDIVVFMVARLMDPSTRREWEKNLGRTTSPPTLDRLKSFLQGQALIYEAVEESSGTIPKPASAARKPTLNSSFQTSSPQKKEKKKKEDSKKCPACGEKHYLNRCPVFKLKTLAEKRSIVNEQRLCSNCFGHHNVNECQSTFTCFVCKSKHHTLLHNPKKDNITSPVSQQATNNQANPVVAQPSSAWQNQNSQYRANPAAAQPASVFQPQAATPSLNPGASSFNGASLAYGSHTGVLLGTAQIIVQGPSKQKIKARALIDNCSQPSFIAESLVKRLGLLSTPTYAPVSSVGGFQSVTGRQVTNFTVRPHFSSRFSCEVKALVVPQVCSYIPPHSEVRANFDHLSNLNLADPAFLNDTQIDVLLGADIYALIIQEGVVKGKPDEPIATSSLLGWLVAGSIPLSSNVTSCVTTHSFHCAQSDTLSGILQKFWEQEELPSKKLLTPDEEKCEKHYTENTKREVDGRYCVKLPFKKPVDAPLGNSYNKAVSMLKRMEEKFDVDPEFKSLYFDFINEYIASGHMIEIPYDSPLLKPLEDTFFLPHHAVLKPSSTTTKLRTVFNGSSKTNTGISLNSLLHTGPNLLPELPDLMITWRLYKYVFVADIKQMFRQILLNSENWHYQAIVWRFNPNDPIQIYYLVTVTYGLVCSAFLASRTLQQLAADYQFRYALAFLILLYEIYMDDVLSGGHTIQEAIDKQTQLINLLKEGGFELRKWLSNDPEILAQLPEDHLATDSNAIFEASSSFAVLGLQWQAKDDTFTFDLKYSPIEGPLRKRAVLSKLAQIFDPMGWLAPVTISAKIFMQSLWLLKCGWDDPLPPDYVNQWEAWTSKLPFINSLSIPRYVQYSPDVEFCEVQGFADASDKACSAVVYLRLIRQGEVECSLQIAKTKVAPLKKLSTPKLELLAAYMLSKLVHHFATKLPAKIDAIHLWSDSKDVLFWLRSHPAKWKTFVANRCSAIHGFTPKAYWHHVKSADNPADVASRGISPDLLSTHPLWWHGPPWLRTTTTPWNTAPDQLLEHNPIEEKTMKIGLVTNTAICLVTPERQMWSVCCKYSSLTTLLRVTAYALRFVYKLYRKVIVRKSVHGSFTFYSFLNFTDVNEEFLSSKELQNSKLLWTYHCQQTYLSEDINNLKKHKATSKSLRGLSPFLQSEFLRVGGRLDQSMLPYDQKHPIILPSYCFFGQLLIRHAHALRLHGGTQLCLATLRTEYWLINGRQAVKNVINACKVCIKYAAKPQNQIMGDLPSY